MQSMQQKEKLMNEFELKAYEMQSQCSFVLGYTLSAIIKIRCDFPRIKGSNEIYEYVEDLEKFLSERVKKIFYSIDPVIPAEHS